MKKQSTRFRLYLLRHGESQANVERLFAGRHDSPLTKEGLKQTAAAAHRLAGLPLAAIYTSPLRRAHTMAAALAAGRSLRPTICEALQEISFGTWEGLSYEEVMAAEPEIARSWLADPWRTAPPAGESFADCLARVQSLPRLWTQQTLPSLADHAGVIHIAVTAHGGVLRALLLALLDVGPELALHFDFSNASLSVIDLFDQTAVVSCLNDTSHLDRGGLTLP